MPLIRNNKEEELSKPKGAHMHCYLSVQEKKTPAAVGLGTG